MMKNSNKKNQLFLFVFFLFIRIGVSQQLPQYTNYLLNYHALNPAAAGSNGCVDIKAGYRTQWVGFEGAPKTQFVQANYFLKRKRKLWKRSKHAIGFLVENDQTGSKGPIRQSRFAASYAFHVPVSRTAFFAAGLYAGLNQFVVQADRFDPFNQDDPLLTGSGRKLAYPDLNPGILYYSDKGFIGLSVKNAYGNKLGGALGSASRMNRHFFLTGGYTIGGERALFRYTPSVNLKFVTMNLPSVDVSFMVTYNKEVDFGVAYRLIDGASAFVNYRVKKWGIGYAYDYNLSKVRFASSNSHEIIISYKICPGNQSDYGESEHCPAYR
jgi:type IX secretion system PorP/SprF family membrane protein